MNNVRCPLCGEINPADAERCLSCEMPLNPDGTGLNPDEQEITNDDEPIAPEETEYVIPTELNTDQDSEDDDFDWLNGLRKQTAGTKEFNIPDDQSDVSAQKALADLGVPTWINEALIPEDPSPMEINPAVNEADIESLSVVDPISPSNFSSSDEDQILEWFDNLEGDAQIDDFEISADYLLSGIDFPTPDSASTRLGEKQEVNIDDQIPSPIYKEPSAPAGIHTQSDADSTEGDGIDNEDRSQHKNPDGDPSPTVSPEVFSNLEFELPQAVSDSEFFPDDLSWMDVDTGIVNIDPSDNAGETFGASNLLTPATPEKPDAGDKAIFDQAKSVEQSIEGLSGLVLPDWLKAMGPIEMRADENSGIERRSTYIEKAGPLAGLMNALPAEPELSLSANPPTLTSILQITDIQKAHSQLLEQIIGGENNPKPEAPQPRSDKRTLTRIVIAICLFSAAIISQFVGWVPLQPAPSVGADVYLAKTLVDNLPEKSPVLIAMEYSPGYSAELEIGARLIVRDLVQSGHYPIFVSTNPLGPLLTERMMAELETTMEVGLDLTYTNLGFVSGGTAGIRSFAQDPRGTVQLDIHSQPVWRQAEFEGIQSIASFPLVVIITENPERFREWIEQARPLLKGGKLLTVVSAQDEPIVRAFIGSGSANQVQGLVSGIGGATEYALLMGDQTLLSDMWHPHAYVATASLGLIIVLGFINLIASKLKYGNRTEVKN